MKIAVLMSGQARHIDRSAEFWTRRIFPPQLQPLLPRSLRALGGPVGAGGRHVCRRGGHPRVGGHPEQHARRRVPAGEDRVADVVQDRAARVDYERRHTVKVLRQKIQQLLRFHLLTDSRKVCDVREERRDRSRHDTEGSFLSARKHVCDDILRNELCERHDTLLHVQQCSLHATNLEHIGRFHSRLNA